MPAVDHSELPGRVLKTYETCLEAGDVLYYPSEVTREDNPLRTEIRLCESLSKKPGPTPSQLGKEPPPKPKEKKDVFDPEHWDELLVHQFDGGFGEEYGVLLNKFAVVPMHFLLVTKHYEKQTSPLTPPQLLASYEIIHAFSSTPITPSSYTKSGAKAAGEILCFYNCGLSSGASQEHKHVQFAPMEGEGSLGTFPTERAASKYKFDDPLQEGKPFSLDELPYAHYIRRLDTDILENVAEEEHKMHVMRHLGEVYLSLLDAMLDGLRALPDLQKDDGQTGEAVDQDQYKLGKGLSYNLLLTRKHMHIIPRRKAVYEMPARPPANAEANEQNGDTTPEAGEEQAIIGCNALAYTGTVLVKSNSDAKRLSELGGVLTALKECGYPVSEPVGDVNQEH